MRVLATALASAAIFGSALAGQSRQSAQGGLFSPADLGILESPDRDEWQQPDRIMDELQIADGSRVADVGAGGGWFTIRLARRVGQSGVVFAEDIQPEMLQSIRRRVKDQNLKNVEPILGLPDDPKLPERLQAVLMVDTYSQVRDPVTLLGRIAGSLAANGLVGIVDFTRDGAGGPGPPIAERVDPDKVRRDAAKAGLTLKAHRTFLRYQYLLIFGK